MRAASRRAALTFAAPADRGPLLGPAQVAAMIGGVSPAWVRRTVPGKLRLGQRTVRWHEYDVRDWIDGHEGNKSGAFTAVNTPR